ncbi:hypothetical protein JR316_0012743 [Psilocybe cubensis]|uniref:Uncharacterized protein n=1 Tax=Psilocybe cubensis TaxID=181762 RepID=A0ACB8GIX3_PSICU|nr:hypothetical protein JR316_0012743 [Psilocybe cubensis]KAH9475626.1 hypothetical protein JR316_0012743 [Psilocybe cubensis]
MEIAVVILDAQSVSSITLLSHHFRILANIQRLSHLDFDSGTIRKLHQLHGLATLIEEAAGYSMRGIHTFIASIYIHIQEECDAYQMQANVTILNHLFRDDALLATPIRKLSLYLTNITGLFAVEPAMEASFRSLLKESHINFLELYYSDDIPFDLLQESKIEHLSLLCVGGLYKPYNRPKALIPIYLKSFSISLYPTTALEIHDLLVLLGLSRSNPFPHLTSLSISTALITFGTELLKLTKCLETLTLDCAEETFRFMAESLNPGKNLFDSQLFRHLKFLNINYRLHARHLGPDGPLAGSLVGQSLPPQLEKLCITLRLEDMILDTLTGPDYGHLDEGVLLKEAVSWDENLSSPVYRSRKDFVVQMNRQNTPPPFGRTIGARNLILHSGGVNRLLHTSFCPSTQLPPHMIEARIV